MLIQDINNPPDVNNTTIASMDQSFKKKIGEELIIDKIHRIFDEVAREAQQFEESYQSLPGAKKKNDLSTISNGV